MNTWNTLLESYQQRIYKHTHATVKRQIKQSEDPTPAVVIRVDAARVDNVILLNYLTSEVAFEEPEIASTDPTILIYKNCTDDKLDFRMTGGSGDYEHDGDKSDECNAIRTGNRR